MGNLIYLGGAFTIPKKECGFSRQAEATLSSGHRQVVSRICPYSWNGMEDWFIHCQLLPTMFLQRYAPSRSPGMWRTIFSYNPGRGGTFGTYASVPIMKYVWTIKKSEGYRLKHEIPFCTASRLTRAATNPVPPTIPVPLQLRRRTGMAVITSTWLDARVCCHETPRDPDARFIVYTDSNQSPDNPNQSTIRPMTTNGSGLFEAKMIGGVRSALIVAFEFL